MRYRMPLRGNLSNSGKLFALQNKIFIVALGAQPVSACKSPFKTWGFYLFHASSEILR
jgi:hypothetical protein